MRKRRGIWYPTLQCAAQWRAVDDEETSGGSRKRRRGLSSVEIHSERMAAAESVVDDKPDLFDGLPDDLIISILSKISGSAASPSNFVSVKMTYVVECS